MAGGFSFMGERRGKQTRGHEVEQRALEVAARNAEFLLGPKCHLAGVASGLSRPAIEAGGIG